MKRILSAVILFCICWPVGWVFASDVTISADIPAYANEAILDGIVNIKFDNESLYNESVKLSYHIYGKDGRLVLFENQRIPFDISDGRASVPITIDLSSVAHLLPEGEIKIKFDLVDEKNIFWFNDSALKVEAAEIVAESPSARTKKDIIGENLPKIGDKQESFSIKFRNIIADVQKEQRYEFLLNIFFILIVLSAFILYKKKYKKTSAAVKIGHRQDIPHKNHVQKRQDMYESEGFITKLIFGSLYRRFDRLERRSAEIMDKVSYDNILFSEMIGELKNKFDTASAASLVNFNIIKDGQKSIFDTANINFNVLKNGQNILIETSSANFNAIKDGQSALMETASTNFNVIKDGQKAVADISAVNFNILKSNGDVFLNAIKDNLFLVSTYIKNRETAAVLDFAGIAVSQVNKLPGAEEILCDYYKSSLDVEKEFSFFNDIPFERFALQVKGMDSLTVAGLWAEILVRYLERGKALRHTSAMSAAILESGEVLCPPSLLAPYTDKTDAFIVCNPFLSMLLVRSASIIDELKDKIENVLILTVSMPVKPFEVRWKHFDSAENNGGVFKKWGLDFNEESAICLHNNTMENIDANVSFDIASPQRSSSVEITACQKRFSYSLSEKMTSVKFNVNLIPGENWINFDFYGGREFIGGDHRELKFVITGFRVVLDGLPSLSDAEIYNYNTVTAESEDHFIRKRLHRAGFFEIHAEVCANKGFFIRELPTSMFTVTADYYMEGNFAEKIRSAAAELGYLNVPVLYKAYRKKVMNNG